MFLLLLVAAAAWLSVPSVAHAAVRGFDGSGRVVVHYEEPHGVLAIERDGTVTPVESTPDLEAALGTEVIVRDGHVVAARAAATPPAKTYRTLVLPITAGPQPFSTAQIREAFNGATYSLERFLRAVSGGAIGVQTTVAPWLTSEPALKPCNTPTDAADAAARAAGYEPNDYDRVVYLGAPPCGGLAGQANAPGRLIWLYGTIAVSTIATSSDTRSARGTRTRSSARRPTRA
jgi:hypothetical protein